jgi:hypothetical protein
MKSWAATIFEKPFDISQLRAAVDPHLAAWTV